MRKITTEDPTSKVLTIKKYYNEIKNSIVDEAQRNLKNQNN